MLAALSPLIAATAQWLTRAYPSDGGALDSALAETQARQAVTVAAWLRYPTAMDAALVAVAGPGGSGRLDWITGADDAEDPDPSDDAAGESAWRTWVDEVVASWAACLLSTPRLAGAAVAALGGCEHANGSPVEFRRLVTPDERDRRAAALLRHPDLLAPIAALHRAQLLDRLEPYSAPAA
ncbi:hypothetical protein AB0K02_30990 [Streptomyces sp. NPDC049597]|uniref:hypothetical protein n=1 Tax=Streptomyces sp. NPDC049597 TaxID=3155276 RepID=UPI00344979E0